ncbi:MAG: rubrerythrin family protein [Candidatus Hydrothermota bacterium]|nr:MAG: rubrerythrin family protein [Candidatus Hydrothermae bacterium]
MEERIRRLLLDFQKNELTEHLVYKNLAKRTKGKNREILERISNDELKHYRIWKRHTGEDVKPDRFKIFLYGLMARIFGLTFAIKLMENGEVEAEKNYSEIEGVVPRAGEILEEETTHENLLISMIEEEKISYISSMVLGLNDALVELTGTLAGLTFALQNTRVVGLAGFITGIAASLSMAASEYLSQKSEEGKNPLKSAFYTGVAYILTVVILVLPYFIFKSYYLALGVTISAVFFVVLIFTFFVSVVKDRPFRGLFFEMIAISIGVAVISFIIGLATRKILGIEV